MTHLPNVSAAGHSVPMAALLCAWNTGGFMKSRNVKWDGQLKPLVLVLLHAFLKA